MAVAAVFHEVVTRVSLASIQQYYHDCYGHSAARGEDDRAGANGRS